MYSITIRTMNKHIVSVLKNNPYVIKRRFPLRKIPFAEQYETKDFGKQMIHKKKIEKHLNMDLTKLEKIMWTINDINYPTDPSRRGKYDIHLIAHFKED